MDCPGPNIHHGNTGVLDAIIGKRGYLGMIPARVDGSGKPTETPVQLLSCLCSFLAAWPSSNLSTAAFASSARERAAEMSTFALKVERSMASEFASEIEPC